MKTRKLKDIEVSAVGMGCMAFSHGYGKIPSEEYSIDAIRNAYQHGCNFFDTAEVYSPNLSGIGHNELIVGKALEDVRDDVVIATKLMLHSVGFRKSVYPNRVTRDLVQNGYELSKYGIDFKYERVHKGRVIILHDNGKRDSSDGRNVTVTQALPDSSQSSI